MTLRLPVVLGVAAMLVAGCGGSKTLSKADLDARANASCKTYNAKIAALKAPADDTEVPKYLDAAIARLDDNRARLGALKPGQDEKADYAQLLTLVDQTRAIAADLKTATGKHDTKAITAASDRGHAVDAKLAVVAKRLGLTQCAVG